MAVFSQPSFDQHEAVHAFFDGEAGLKGFVVLHSTRLGPALGGCRCWQFEHEDLALSDALRLSRGVSYRNAMANIPYGGGMAVIITDEEHKKSTAMFEAFGHVLNRLNGAYIATEDLGTTIDDMKVISGVSEFVNVVPRKSDAGSDQSVRTAQSVIAGMKAAARVALSRDDLEGVSVAVQGVGNVGYALCRQLHDEGAKLIISDAHSARSERAADEFDADVLECDEILAAEADILAPCAVGGVLNAETIPWLSMKIICGAANNQLATDKDSDRISRRGIVYVPDFVVNAGGIISAAAKRDEGAAPEEVDRRISFVGDRVASIIAKSEEKGKSTHTIACAMAQDILLGGKY